MYPVVYHRVAVLRTPRDHGLFHRRSGRYAPLALDRRAILSTDQAFLWAKVVRGTVQYEAYLDYRDGSRRCHAGCVRHTYAL